jgi:arylformamidase
MRAQVLWGAGAATAILLASVALITRGGDEPTSYEPTPYEPTPYEATRDLSYDLRPPTPDRAHNRLDVYEPAEPGTDRPVVVWFHGGTWRLGDKSLVDFKPELFTSAGYVFVSANYRLSPEPPELANPDRVMFPDHVNDAAEAVAWVYRNISAYRGDPTRVVLAGSSAGGHLASLVAVRPDYTAAYDVPHNMIRGVVLLDGRGLDLADEIGRATAPVALETYYNAFGTPEQDAARNIWARASPIRYAQPGDPPHLLVTGAGPVLRERMERMAAALGQDPATTVLPLALRHVEITAVLGDPADESGETDAVLEFVASAFATTP